MPLYESVFIARQDLTPAQVETLSGTVAELITKEGGKVTKTEQWGLKTLAYRIKKNKKGHYVLMNIDSPAAAITEMERTMRINEDVLRYLTIRMDQLEEEPSVMLRKRDEDAREGAGGFGPRSGGFGSRDRGDRDSGRPMRPRLPSNEGEQA
jgi:small subunit ribosomal protein S6